MHVVDFAFIALVITPILALPHSISKSSFNAISRRHEPRPPSPDTQVILDRLRREELERERGRQTIGPIGRQILEVARARNQGQQAPQGQQAQQAQHGQHGQQ